ncbi:hypothetical protein IJC60_04895 [bacterium]|nr:hypothetical protein [bacterium]
MLNGEEKYARIKAHKSYRGYMLSIKKIITTLMLVLFVSANTVPAFAYDYKIEHIKPVKRNAFNQVNIMSDEAVILQHNLLKIAFNSNFNSKTAVVGERIDFSLKEGLTTIEGTRLLPEGTIICGVIQKIVKPKVFNRNAKVYMAFDKIIFPSGEVFEFCALPNTKDNVLKRSSWAAVGKAAAWTVGLFGVGAGAGAAIGSAASAAGTGCLVFGMPIGGGVGLLLGVITPGLHYKKKAGKKIVVELQSELVLPRLDCIKTKKECIN